MNDFSPFAAVVLAAGSSRRMAGEAKLLKHLQGRPLLAHCLATVTGLGLSRVVVVVRPGAAEACVLDKATAPVSRLPIEWLPNNRTGEGMGTSIAAGIANLPETVLGAFIVLGDMPFVDAGTYRQLARAFLPSEGTTICAPAFGGRLGHPVLFGKKHFEALRTLRGDVGGRSLLKTRADELVRVAVDDRHVLTDLDQPGDFAHWNRRGSSANSGLDRLSACDNG